jgi:hypothetical protein
MADVNNQGQDTSFDDKIIFRRIRFIEAPLGLVRSLRAWRVGLSCCAIVACAMATAASAASAQTFYVNQRSGEDTSACTSPSKPCATINGAIAKAEKAAPPNTIEVNSGQGFEGLYEESIILSSPKDAGLTINGEEPGVVIVGKGDPGVSSTVLGGVTLSNLKVEASKGPAFFHSALLDLGSALTLNNVAVENESSIGENGIDAKSGSVTMTGGSVAMEGGAIGYAVHAITAPLALNGVTIITGEQSQDDAGGVYSEKASLSMTNSKVAVESSFKSIAFGIAAGKEAPVALQNVAVRQKAPALGVVFEEAPATVNGLKVEMLDSASNLTAVDTESETASGSATFSNLKVDGTWTGEGLFAAVPEVTLTDSRIAQSALSQLPALRFAGSGAGRGLVVQRSELLGASGAKPGALTVTGGNATTDSSEILGGKDGVYFEDAANGPRALTLSASTVDAGAEGIAGDAPGTHGVEAVAKNGSGSLISASIQGSIVLEKQAALAEAGGQAGIGCAYSAAPSQAQPSGGGEGAIACAAGVSGNTDVNPLSSLFAEPLSALSGYNLSPTSSAVGSVPPGAISLPFGLNPSATDLAGNPRTGDGVDACFTAQDKGALELQGHLVSCPTTPTGTTTTTASATATAASSPTTSPNGDAPKPHAGVITALAVNPSSFAAAPSGATISTAVPAGKRSNTRYGATISYRDSQIATTTFTILREESGRTQSKSCKKPSKSNRHGKRCTLFAPVGTFSHADLAGPNSLHFSGRLNGRKLAKGRYRLSSVARNGAGAGSVAIAEFKITG